MKILVKPWVKRLAKNAKKCCRNISLHGFVNISESTSGLEMLFWIIVQILCLMLCVLLMITHWVRYQSKPTVTTIKSTSFPIAGIPFPAVSICNSNTIHKRQTNLYKQILMRRGVEAKIIDEYFSSMKYINFAEDIDTGEFREIEETWEVMNISITDLIKSLAHPCEEMIHDCTWSGLSYNCNDLFRLVKTERGICCSFNYHNDLVHTKYMNTTEEKKPFTANGAGVIHGLSVSLNIGTDNYMSTRQPFEAIFVVVHPVWDYPDLTAFSVAIQEKELVLLQVIPTVFTCEERLKTVPHSKRQCWFGNEGHLKTTNDYSFVNCVVECKARAINKFCRCVPYYYPTLEGHRICTLMDIQCLKKYELLYNSIYLADQFLENKTACNCLPQCENILYRGYINKVKTKLPEDQAMLQVYFSNSWCVEYSVNLNLTWDVLLASLGGIFGLCLGGSLISVSEIFFYTGKCVYETFLKPEEKNNSGLQTHGRNLNVFMATRRENLNKI